MASRDQRPIDDVDQSTWYRFGVLIGIANLVFIALVVLLLQYNLYVGLVFAVVVSVVGGFAVTWYALRNR